jgi:CYTH domain-containing protein
MEFEYEIPISDAKQLLTFCVATIIEKPDMK